MRDATVETIGHEKPAADADRSDAAPSAARERTDVLPLGRHVRSVGEDSSELRSASVRGR